MTDQMPTPTAPPAADPLPTHAFGTPVYQTAPSPTKESLFRWLVGLAWFGAFGRALVIAACANRISFADNLLDGGTGTLDDANRADHLVTGAGVVSMVAFFAFLGILLTMGRRAKNGDQLGAAINNNPRLKLTSRIYFLAVVASFFLGSILKTDSSASAEDRMQNLVHRDWATIGINVVVIVFLVVVAVTTRREFAKARAAGSII